MSDFNATYPEYAATARLDELRATEYSYLDEGGHVYLDYTGAGLPAQSQLLAHTARLRAGCYGNPHSDNPTSSASTRLIEQAREAVLRFFNTTAAEYAVIFTPNATGACRLVAESYPWGRRTRFAATADNHNSVHGIREYAQARGSQVAYAGLSGTELRTSAADVAAALGAGHGARSGLFAYPAQSNFSGVQHPLDWVRQAQDTGYDVLLDAAAFVGTNPLDLSAIRPQFVAVSWYKVFGFPTGVGCLLARRDALARLRRPWFSGGTILAASAQGGWHRMLDDEAGFEDGMLNFLAPDGRVVDERAVGRDAADAGISLRTGCFCNPGAGERAFGLTREVLRARRLRVHGTEMSSVDDYLSLVGLPTGGAVQVSLGVASTLADVDAFLDFAERTYRDRWPGMAGLSPRLSC